MTAFPSSPRYRMSVAKAMGVSILLFFPIIHLINPGREIAYADDWSLAAYAITGLALIVAYARSSGHGPALWVTVIAAAPVFAPLVSMEVLGFDRFSLVGSAFQNERTIVAPLVVAALSCMSIALLTAGSHGDRVLDRCAGRSSQLPPRNGKAALIWLVIALLIAVVAAIANNPTFDPVWRSSYKELLDRRVKEVAFAEGVFMAAFVIALASKLTFEHSSASKRTKRAASLLFWVVLVLSGLWKLVHGGRVAISGIGLFVWLLYGRPPSLTSVKWIFLISLIVVFALVGYTRNHRWDALSLIGYVPMPGGVENVMSGWVAAYWLSYDGELDLVPGQTYAAEIQRLPPKMLEFERWPLPYDLVAEHVYLVGGEYFPIEPLINFGVAGLVFYILLFSIVTNSGWRAVTEFVNRPSISSASGFVLGGVWYCLLFRTLWYGLAHVIKTEIIALLLLWVIRTSISRLHVPIHSKARLRLGHGD